MEDKLAVGMYVRTKWGIAKIIDFEAQNFLIKLDKKIMYENLPEYYDYTTIGNIIKASHSIIDLVQVGDYVNDELVKNIEVDSYKDYAINSGYWCKQEEIQSIVTKEQFESMKYEVR